MKIIEYKSYAKINLFLKIVGIRGNYHEIYSRFIKVYSLYDILSFKESIQKDLFIESDFNFPQSENIIYKTYQSLLLNLDSQKIKIVKDFFQKNSLKVEKNIPMMAGLGGGSSNSATFLNMVNETLNLDLNITQKIKIVENLGSDIIFFLYNFNSANVYGTGEIVNEFQENKLDIEIFTPKINCNTGNVFKEFRKNFFNIEDISNLEYLKDMKSKDFFKNSSIEFANDLFQPAKSICPELIEFQKNGYLFSGSGSSFFKIKD